MTLLHGVWADFPISEAIDWFILCYPCDMNRHLVVVWIGHTHNRHWY